MRVPTLLPALVFGPVLYGQTFQAGILGGGGSFGAADINLQSSWVVGAEVCGRCSKAVAVYGQYFHYTIDSKFLKQADVADLGLRLQFLLERRVRPFADVGFAVGSDRFQPEPSRTDSHTLAGFGAGGGATFDLGRRFYVRPLVKMHVLGRGFHVGLTAAVAFGLRL